MIHKRWGIDDQLEFARISGDFNPLHVDPLEARRFLFGKTIVHGIHLCLWAMDEYFKSTPGPAKLKRLKVCFSKPVGIDEMVILQEQRKDNSSVDFSIERNGVVGTTLSLEFFPNDTDQVSQLYPGVVFDRKDPRHYEPKDLANAQGAIDIAGDITLLQRNFPSLHQNLPTAQILLILSTTRLVGMECPGLNSIYYTLILDFDEKPGSGNRLDYKVSGYNDVFKLVDIHLKSPIASGNIKAFVRPSLQLEHSVESIIQNVKKNEFEKQKALIIGGSRGLGAVTAKVLALGGADVCITYSQGQKEALRICNELKPFQCAIRAIQFNVLEGETSITQALGSGWMPTHMYYFATPFIFDGVKKKFSDRLFERFCQYYVQGFWRLFSELASDPRFKFVFYPSSSALTELPPNMFEYAAAKAAGENMCEYIRKYYPGIEIISCRLERLATEQTVSILPVENKDPLPILINILRGKGLSGEE